VGQCCNMGYHLVCKLEEIILVNTVNFSHDWNSKLTGGGKLFTTIRKGSPQKETYYKTRIGEGFDVGI
jgi:hypothetical protein